MYLVDDERCVREALTEMLEAFGMRVISFASATEYLAFIREDEPWCVVLDMRLPDMSGLELQCQSKDFRMPPIIFISGLADIRSAVRAMRAGAIEFLMKPVDPDTLRRAIETAIARDRVIKRRQAELDELQRRYTRLTPRERGVLSLVVGGLLNKQSASVLGISEITLQIHRSQVMRKMEAASLAELVTRRENVLLLGNSGTGKSHIALALGLAACQRGHRVRFTTTAALVSELIEARPPAFASEP